MPVDLIKYAFTAGEISPRLLGRSDLNKFDLGLALCRNWIVDYRGGITTRNGTEFGDFIDTRGDHPFRFFRFTFSTDVKNVYCLLFGHQYIRFIQNNAYILEGDKTTVLQDEHLRITDHGFETGDWLKVIDGSQVGRTIKVSKINGNVFDALDPITGVQVTSALIAGARVARVYTVVTPYIGEDLAELRAEQSRDLVRITRWGYPIKNLIRRQHANWLLEDEVIGTTNNRIPRGISMGARGQDSKLGSGNAGALFAITSVDKKGNESLPARFMARRIADYATTAGSVKLTWAPMRSIEYFNVYRSIIMVSHEDLNLSHELGYLGRAYGPVFVDDNIIPDFTRAPPVHYNPFANRAIQNINVTNSGSGYRNSVSIVVTDPTGADFQGFAVVDGGQILAVVIENGGHDYTDPIITTGPDVDLIRRLDEDDTDLMLGGFTNEANAFDADASTFAQFTGTEEWIGWKLETKQLLTKAFIDIREPTTGVVTIELRYKESGAEPTSASDGILLSTTTVNMARARNQGRHNLTPPEGSHPPSLYFWFRITGPNTTYKIYDADLGPFHRLTTDNLEVAEFEVVVGPASGNDPAISAMFQQRQVYGATINAPLTIYGSQSGRFSNFDVSRIVKDNDSIEFEIESSLVSPLTHFIPTRGGLLIMTQTGVWLLSGGSPDKPVTPTQALSDPHSYTGAALIEPLKIDSDILYVEGKGYTVRLLSYNEFSKIYSGLDVSILSSHLLGPNRRVTRWAFGYSPTRIAWVVTSDGHLLAFTVVKEQEVYAWARMTTEGMFLDAINIQEDIEDSIYFGVRRFENQYFFERLARVDEIEHAEDSWNLDCALAMPVNRPDTVATIYALTGTTTVKTDKATFTLADEGKIFRALGGKATVTDFVNSKQITIEWIRDAEIAPEDTLPYYADAGHWSIDQVVSIVGGLWHLEGKTVWAVVDGNAFPDLVVANGFVTLPLPGSRVLIGLKYKCVARTLPLTASGAVIEGRRKRVTSTATRLLKSRGLKAGPDLDHLYEMKERTTEIYSEATRLQTGLKFTALETMFDTDGSVYYVQDYPLPASIIGVIAETDIGDANS